MLYVNFVYMQNMQLFNLKLSVILLNHKTKDMKAKAATMATHEKIL